jgi:predicted membrane-bound dolichyl-phosphate-mannose-protein mannosyltransferase
MSKLAGDQPVSAQGERRKVTGSTEAVDAPQHLVVDAEALPEEDLWDRFGRTIDRFLPAELHVRLLWLLLLASLLLRLLWLARPDGALIFDESYYVNAVRVILGIPPGQDRYQDRPFGLDPNTEHPPLAKLLVAGSMALLGDNAYGWRLPSVLFGTASILLLYGVARRVGASPNLALLTAGLLAFDTLAFVHSRIFTLDIFQLGFMLLGLYWYVGGRPSLAGLGFALAALCKIGGGFGLVAMAGYEALRLRSGDQSWRIGGQRAARRLVRMGATFAIAFLLLLGGMDRVWVGYSQPFEHLERIITYGTLLRRSVPSGIESYPWQWLWNERQIPYIRIEQQVKVGEEIRETRPVVLFLGAMNPYVLQLWPLGLAFAAYAWWGRRPGADLSALALAWFACTYLPFYAASLFGQRISYLFYFLPTLPAVALMGGHFLLEAGLPRLVIGVYVLAVLLGFYGYFPFKPAA